MPSSSANIRTLIFGGIAFVSLSVLCYFFYFRPGPPSSIKQIKDVEHKKVEDKEKTSATDTAKGITVEDVEDSEEEESDEEESESESGDEEEEEEEQKTEETVQLEVKKTVEAEKETNNKAAKPPSTEGEVTNKQVEGKAKDLPEKDELTLLKEQYDAAVRLGQKLIAGQLNERAAEKLTEAITLAAKVPSAQKDILTLYNNRSAMYEKLGQFENAIRDINIVLAMDPFHVKARVRRARVNESQNKATLALHDYVYATIIERSRGSESNYDKKITELSKKVAIDRTPQTLKELRSSQKKRALPSKAYCRNFMEAYPNSYAWKQAFYGVSREELVSAYHTKKTEFADHSTDKGVANGLLKAGLDLVKYDLSHDCYKKAFESLHDLPFESLSQSSVSNQLHQSLLSQYHELLGTELHLMFQMEEASSEYEVAINLYPANLTAQLKYNSVLLENGERDRALASYQELLSLLKGGSSSSNNNSNNSNHSEEEGDFEKVHSNSEKSSEDGFADARSSPVSLSLDQESEEMKTAYLAWVYNHRASLFVSRDEFGFYTPDALTSAMEDIDESLKQSGNVMHLAEGKGAHFIALLKSVQLRTHTKQAMEQVTTESDYAANRLSIQAAKTLFPDHESVLLLEVEQLALEGDTETATKLVDKASRSGLYDEFIIVNLRATITTNQAFVALQGNAANTQTMSYAQSLFEEVNRLYQRALELDPESLEVKAQFAQLKSMMFGDLEGAIQLLQDALSIARSRDEVQDLLTMLVGNEAQAAAIEEIKKSQQ